MRKIPPQFIVLWLVACQSAGGIRDIPYETRPSPVEGAPASVTDTPFHEVAEVLGIPNLHSVVLPAGYREIRISDSFGMIAGSEIPMLRLVEDPHGVTGQLIRFWVVPDWDALSPRSGARCATRRNDLRICAAIDASPRDWPGIAAELNRMTAWTIRGRCREAVSSVADAGDLIIQRLDSASYDTYLCNAPLYRTESTIGRNAKAIFEYLHSMSRS